MILKKGAKKKKKNRRKRDLPRSAMASRESIDHKTRKKRWLFKNIDPDRRGLLALHTHRHFVDPLDVILVSTGD